jgi:hypothetical protein
MKNSYFVIALLLAVMAGIFTATSALAGGEYGSANCATDGGEWTGPVGVYGTGTCAFAENTAIAIAACGPDKQYVRTFDTGYQTASDCYHRAGILCENDGGTWSGGVDLSNGSCTYPVGSSVANSSCGVGFEYIEHIIGGGVYTIACIYGGSTDGSEGDESDDESSETDAEGLSDEPITLSLGGDNNGNATFSPDACPQKCSISSSLPAAAKASVPGNAMATMYVRVVDEGGTSGAGTYTVCFKNPDGTPLVIYKFVAGAWVAQTFASTGDRICVSSSGDGAFYLGS